MVEKLVAAVKNLVAVVKIVVAVVEKLIEAVEKIGRGMVGKLVAVVEKLVKRSKNKPQHNQKRSAAVEKLVAEYSEN